MTEVMPGAAPLTEKGSGMAAELWEGCSSSELERTWQLPRVRLLTQTDSTNDAARVLAIAGAPTGTLVIADEQRAGRGRMGRPWFSPPGVGLWLSVVMRSVAEHAIETLPLRIALSVAEALDAWVDAPVRIKWPNDLLLGDRKVGGILCEGVWEGGMSGYVVAGIGLNLLQRRDDFPAEIRDSATSLNMGANRGISRFEVASAVVERLHPLFLGKPGQIGGLRPSDLVGRDALLDRAIDIIEPSTGRTTLTGTARGIEPSGALRVESAGRLTLVRTGTVRLSEP